MYCRHHNLAPDPEITAGLYSGPVQLCAVAVAVLIPAFRFFTSTLAFIPHHYLYFNVSLMRCYQFAFARFLFLQFCFAFMVCISSLCSY